MSCSRYRMAFPCPVLRSPSPSSRMPTIWVSLNLDFRMTAPWTNIEYNNNYYRVGSSWSYADLTVSVAVPVRRLIITPSIRFLGGLADDFEDQVVGGVNVHVDF